MAGKTITSANAVFLLSVAGLFSTPQPLQEFGVDDAFMTDPVDVAETQLGVDLVGVAGYVTRSVMMTIRFLASSSSIAIFETWNAAQDQLGDILYGSAIITLPSVGAEYTFYRGVLRRISSLPDARKVLANREFHIEWLPPGGGAPPVTASII